MYVIELFNTGVGNLQPEGWIRPADRFEPARDDLGQKNTNNNFVIFFAR